MFSKFIHKLGLHTGNCTCRDNALGLHRSVFSILRGNQSKNHGWNFAGCGFFVGDASRLIGVTAAHVLDESHLRADESFFVGHRSIDGPVTANISGILKSKKYDLACFSLPVMPSVHPISLFSGWAAPAHANILCFEYSATSKFRCGHGHDHLHLEHSIHNGHVVRYFTSDFPEKVPTWSILTSFPFLQGASGAPVLLSENYSLLGVAVANYEQHLLPAQLVSIENEKSETKYFLPYGKAIHAGAVREFLSESGVAYSQRSIRLPSETPHFWRSDV